MIQKPETDASNQLDAKAAAASVEAGIARMEARLEQLQQANESARWFMLIAITLLVVIVGWFLYKTYDQVVNRNFEITRVQQAAEAPVRELTPQVMREAERVAAEVLPVYKDLAFERAKVIGPEISARLQEHARTLPAELYMTSNEKFQEMLQTVDQRLRADLKEKFPDLADPAVQDAVAAHLHLEFEKQFTGFDARRREIFERELVRVNNAMQKFEVPEEMLADDYPVDRLFAHTLIMLVDYELMRGGDNPLVEEAVAN